MTRSDRSWALLWLLALSLVCFAVYFRGLTVGYYSDDYSYLFTGFGSDPFYFFYHENPGVVMYRPLQSTFLAAVQNVWGLSTLPIHITHYVCHILLAWLVAISLRRLGYTRLQGMIASLFLLLAQINTYGLISNDTLSQIGGVFFGTLAAWLLFFPGRQNAERARPRPIHYVLALLSFAAGLSLKETTVSYLGIIGVALLAANYERSRDIRAFVRSAVQGIPFLALAIGYMVVRSLFVTIQPQFGGERYDLAFGMNIPKNIALFIVAAATAPSSVTTYVAMEEKNYAVLIPIVASVLIVLAAVAIGLWMRRKDRQVWVLLAMMFIGFFPSIIINRVSEHYLYNSLPFIAALVGIAFGEIYQRASRPALRAALAGGFALLMITEIVSIQSKISWMQANADRADELLEELRPFVATAPRNGAVYLLNPPNDTPQYSIYRMNDYSVLEFGGPGTQTVLGRPDVKLEVREPIDSTILRNDDSTLVLTMEHGKVVRYK